MKSSAVRDVGEGGVAPCTTLALMQYGVNDGARSAAVMFSGLMLTTVTVLMAVSLRHADVRTALPRGAVYFACVIAPALVAWLTRRRLSSSVFWRCSSPSTDSKVLIFKPIATRQHRAARG